MKACVDCIIDAIRCHLMIKNSTLQWISITNFSLFAVNRKGNWNERDCDFIFIFFFMHISFPCSTLSIAITSAKKVLKIDTRNESSIKTSSSSICRYHHHRCRKIFRIELANQKVFEMQQMLEKNVLHNAGWRNREILVKLKYLSLECSNDVIYVII